MNPVQNFEKFHGMNQQCKSACNPLPVLLPGLLVLESMLLGAPNSLLWCP